MRTADYIVYSEKVRTGVLQAHLLHFARQRKRNKNTSISSEYETFALYL